MCRGRDVHGPAIPGGRQFLLQSQVSPYKRGFPAPDTANRVLTVKTRHFHPLRTCILTGLLALPASFTRAQAPADKKVPAPTPAAAPAAGAKVIPDVDLGDPAGIGVRADEAFAKGEWLNAAANYNGLLTIGIKVGVKPEELEPLYFVIGVCMYNLPNYDEAYKRFTEYTQKYPTGPKVHQVNLAIARIFRAQKKWPEAVKQYKPLVTIPAVKDDALIELADAHKENQEKDKAIILLETTLAAGLKSTADVRAALYLVELYQEDKPEKGVAMLERVKLSPGSRAVVSEINFAAMKLAESLMQSEKFQEALAAFQNIRKKKEVVDTLKDLDADYARAIASLSKRVGPKMPNAAANLQQLDRIKFFQVQAKTMITNLEKEANYDAVLFYRIGRCFAALERYWEARVAFKYVLDNFPKYEDAPNVLYALAYCYYNLAPVVPDEDNLKMGDEAKKYCREFLTKYKDRAEASQVAEMLITLAARTKNPEEVNKVFDEVMDLIKDSPNRAGFLAQQVQNYLQQYEFDKARDAADKFLSDPKTADDPTREAVEYMRGLTWFFKNDYNGAMEQLRAYIAKYPAGGYLPDAKYRLAFLIKGEEMSRKSKKMKGDPRFRNVIEAASDIIQNHANTSSVADAYALIGDCYKEMTGKEKEEAGLDGAKVDVLAADAYMDAIKFAQSDQVAEYSLTQAAPLLKAQGRWEEVRQIYEHFRKSYPDHRITLQAVGEICKAIERGADGFQNKELEEAEKAKNEAEMKKILAARQVAKDEARAKSRAFLAETIMENINNPQKEGVEELMQQLAISAIPKRKAAPVAIAPVTPAVAATTTVPAPPVPPVKRPDPPTVEEQGKPAEAELDRLLASGGTLTNIGKARLVYVKAQLYKYLESKVRPKKDARGQYLPDTSPKRGDALMKQLVSEFKPADYSSAMLAQVGDNFYKEGDKEGAAACFNRLFQFFPNSLFLDWALVGLGDIASDAKDYENALKKYTLATEEHIGSKYGEAILGKARVQYLTDKLEEAKETLKGVLGDKSYPPESKAEALWIIGECKFKQKALPDAFNDFQKIYLSYAKFAKWSCKGYLRAGETKEALGKFEDAKAVYREATETPKNIEKFKGLEDFEKIKARLKAIM